MSYGYSQQLAERNKTANGKLLGVALGRVCIRYGVPVTTVAKTLKVTRATVYNWFVGTHEPHIKYSDKIKELIEKYRG